MFISMTGYGKSEYQLPSGRKITVEIKTTNHRYRDLGMKVPRSIVPLESEIRKYLFSRIQRGRIDLLIQVKDEARETSEVKLDLSLAEKVYSLLTDLKYKLRLKGEITTDLLLHFREIFLSVEPEEETELTWEILEPFLNSALNALEQMRQKEGLALLKDVESRLEQIRAFLGTIESKASAFRTNYHALLKKRVQDLLSDVGVDETRVAQEVAFIVERMDITEEVTRVKSHVSQLKGWLALDEPAGRKIDFLLQEINREVNTMGAKVQDAEITLLTVEIKNELEKIREQIQNIE
ncbi:MAG: YicC family protein [Proteobacteria bacterium]|nr:YicC family protein [Pseudomonadota bacterium]